MCAFVFEDDLPSLEEEEEEEDEEEGVNNKEENCLQYPNIKNAIKCD